MTDPAPGSRASSPGERSLDLVQRLVVSALIVVVIGGPAVSLAFYGPYVARTDRGTGIGLWLMCGVIGLMAAIGVLIANRRKPYSPYVLLGLLPLALGAVLLAT